MRDDIVSIAILNYSNGAVEAIGLHIKLKNLLLIVMYRQPDDVTGGNRSSSG